MSEEPIQDGDKTVDAAAFQAEFEALAIPPNIDPRLLALWIQREQDKIEHARREKEQPPPKPCGRKLTRLFPAYIGIGIMCLSMILGLIQGQEPDAVLKTASIAFLVYAIVGFFIGMIAERCVNDSVETMLRDVVSRSRQPEQE